MGVCCHHLQSHVAMPSKHRSVQHWTQACAISWPVQRSPVAVACTCMRWLLPQHLRPQPPKSVSLLSVAGTAAGGEDELLGLHAEIKRFVEAVSPTPAEVYTKAQALHTVIDACRQALQAGYPGMEVGGKNAARTTATSLCSAASLSGGSVRFQQTPSYISYIHVYQAALVQVAA